MNDHTERRHDRDLKPRERIERLLEFLRPEDRHDVREALADYDAEVVELERVIEAAHDQLHKIRRDVGLAGIDEEGGSLASAVSTLRRRLEEKTDRVQSSKVNVERQTRTLEKTRRVAERLVEVLEYAQRTLEWADAIAKAVNSKDVLDEVRKYWTSRERLDQHLRRVGEPDERS